MTSPSTGLQPKPERSAVPAALRAAFHTWDAAGRPPQPGVRWSREAWASTLTAEYAGVLGRLPDSLDRAAVAAEAGEVESAGGPADLFVAAMVWGYGRVGYGPWRTARVLNNPGANETLAHAAHLVRAKGGPFAFDWMAGHRLVGLGVAFASKFLYFCSAGTDSQPALVLDRLVRDWLANNAGWRVRLDWNRRDYRTYVETMTTWANELAVSPDEVEQLAFTDQVRGDPRSQWATGLVVSNGSERAGGVTVQGGAEETIDVLDTLELLSEGFAAVPELRPGDQADVEAHLRALRRIALIYRHGLSTDDQ